MALLIGTLCTILLTVFVVQIAKARELASVVRADASEEYEVNKFHAGFGMVFMVAFLIACVWSFIYYIPTSLGWGPNIAASEHGVEVDYLFNLTLFFTGIVFILTHIALFWFAWKYRGRPGKKALYWAHNETLEMVWMIVPAVVMTFLVVGGLQAWNNIMTDLPEEAKSVVLPGIDNDKEYLEIEATGSQFLWYLRYPGRDGVIGRKYFTQINSKNPVGQTWEDDANLDDFMTNEIVLPVNRKVRVRVTARDVLHNFYIKDMRVKMDAVPGMPTYFIFTPTVTTDSMRRRLSKRPEWQVPNEDNPKQQRWETFEYELACAELCGRGHYSMRNIVKIVEKDEYLAWLDTKEGGELETVVDSISNTTTYGLKANSVKSQYFETVYGKEGDPQKGNAKIANMETLIKDKVFIKKDLAEAKAIRDAAEYKSAAYNKADRAMADIETQLNITRYTMVLADSKAALASSNEILAELKANTVVEVVTPTVVTDTAATVSVTDSLPSETVPAEVMNN